jgi:hypothetical protein
MASQLLFASLWAAVAAHFYTLTPVSISSISHGAFLFLLICSPYFHPTSFINLMFQKLYEYIFKLY